MLSVPSESPALHPRMGQLRVRYRVFSKSVGAGGRGIKRRIRNDPHATLFRLCAPHVCNSPYLFVFIAHGRKSPRVHIARVRNCDRWTDECPRRARERIKCHLQRAIGQLVDVLNFAAHSRVAERYSRCCAREKRASVFSAARCRD